MRIFIYNRILLLLVLLLIGPFVYAQLPELIPYRKGALWGLCDSNSNVVHPPKYEKVRFVTYLPHRCFEIISFTKDRNKKRVGVINGAKEIVPIEYTWVSSSGTDFLNAKGRYDSRDFDLYDLRGNLIFEKINYYTRLYNDSFKYSIMITRNANDKEKCTLFSFDKESHKPKRILKKEYASIYMRDGFVVAHNDYLSRIPKVSTTNTDVYKIVKSAEALKLDILDKNTAIAFLKRIKKRNVIEQPMGPPKMIDRGTKKKKRQFWVKFKKDNDEDVQRIFLERFDRMFTNNKGLDTTSFSRKNCTYSVVPYRHLTLDKKKVYPYHHTDSGNILTNRFVVSKYQRKKKTAYGFITHLTEVKPQFDSVRGFLNGPKLHVFLVYQKRKKENYCGVMRADGKWILPLQRDFSLSQYYRSEYMYEFVRNELHGLMNSNFQEILPARYDGFIFNPHRSTFITKKVGKYGMFCNKKGSNKCRNVDPIFDDEPGEILTVRSKLDGQKKYLWKMFRRGLFIGYSNSKGLAYYAD